MSQKKALAGIIPALITPLNEDGSVEYAVLEKQVDYLSSAGVHGFFVNGSTGEGPYLTTEEKLEVYKTVKNVSQGRQFLCAACIQPTTQATLEEIRRFEQLEPEYIVAVTPYYFGVSQNVIKKHYLQIAQATDIPVIIYNIPQCTHNKIELDTVLELAATRKFAGTKDSSGDFISFTKAVYSDSPADFAWIQGEDLLDGPSLLVGADGFVTGLGNIWIDPYIEMYQAKEQGQLEQLNTIQKKINALFEVIDVTGTVIPAIKSATALLGRSTHWMRLAGQTLDADNIAKLTTVLEKLHLL